MQDRKDSHYKKIIFALIVALYVLLILYVRQDNRHKLEKEYEQYRDLYCEEKSERKCVESFNDYLGDKAAD